MDEIWERAVETALDGHTDVATVRMLTLDGAVKCGRLPHPSLFEKFPHLKHLSIANIGVSSLEQFPGLRNLQKLVLSDNRIAGGLEFLVQAGLESLRDLDMSNNRIQEIDDLRPLAELRIVSLDLYECPVTRVKDYRSRVFGLIKSLEYLDKMDADENERPESDDEDDDEDGEDDPGIWEVYSDERGLNRLNKGHRMGQDGVLDVDEDEESDADEEADIVSRENGNGLDPATTNGFHAEFVDVDEEEEEDDDDDDYEDDEENDSDEIDEEEDEDEEDVVEVHEIEDSEDDDGVEDDDDYNDKGDHGEPESTDLLTSTEVEIDGHEQGEDEVDEDDDGETGEDEIGVDERDLDDNEEEEDDVGRGYLIQPVVQVAEEGDNDDEEEDDPEVEEEDNNQEDGVHPPSSAHKRKRDNDGVSCGGEGGDSIVRQNTK